MTKHKQLITAIAMCRGGWSIHQVGITVSALVVLSQIQTDSIQAVQSALAGDSSSGFGGGGGFSMGGGGGFGGGGGGAR